VSLRIVLHREIPEDPNLWRQWNDLILQMESPEVFYTCEWALAMQSAYQSSLRPLLFLGYEGDSLIGVASLAIDPTERMITFLAATTGDYCEFLSPPLLRAHFLDAVFAELAKMKWRSMALANLPENSATTAALRSVTLKHGFHAYLRPAYLCAQVKLGVGEPRQELKQNLAGKKKLRRYLRAMEVNGPVTFTHLQSHDQIQAELPVFADAHVARFHVTHRVSSLSTPERRLFLQELSRRFAGTGIVNLSVLKIGGKPMAWNYGFQFHGSWFWYQPTFDSSQEANSPGHCLLSRIVIEACNMEEMKVVDLGLGAEGYKERFGNCTRQTLFVTISRSWLRHLREMARYWAASWLKRSPPLEAVIRKLLERF
jgi:CelD/BcsL family acetyltransferase involved in cellulose biosynthesis